MTEGQRSIELEVEVIGSPEQVWQAIATGPGISSWYVPHELEEKEGGAATARFGPGPEMQVDGRVAAWEPPRRVCFDGGEGVEGLAFEWLVEARDGGTCIVRLVNSGFGSGSEWDDHYDAMTEGWRMFLSNLQTHMRHFPGQAATAALPTAMWLGPPDKAWARLTAQVGMTASPSVGERVELAAPEAPTLAGSVVDVAPTRVTLLLDQPTPGTALVAAEGMGDQVQASVWAYLYGPDGPQLASDCERGWMQWLQARSAG